MYDNQNSSKLCLTLENETHIHTHTKWQFYNLTGKRGKQITTSNDHIASNDSISTCIKCENKLQPYVNQCSLFLLPVFNNNNVVSFIRLFFRIFHIEEVFLLCPFFVPCFTIMSTAGFFVCDFGITLVPFPFYQSSTVNGSLSFNITSIHTKATPL